MKNEPAELVRLLEELFASLDPSVRGSQIGVITGSACRWPEWSHRGVFSLHREDDADLLRGGLHLGRFKQVLLVELPEGRGDELLALQKVSPDLRILEVDSFVEFEEGGILDHLDRFALAQRRQAAQPLPPRRQVVLSPRRELLRGKELQVAVLRWYKENCGQRYSIGGAAGECHRSLTAEGFRVLYQHVLLIVRRIRSGAIRIEAAPTPRPKAVNPLELLDLLVKRKLLTGGPDDFKNLRKAADEEALPHRWLRNPRLAKTPIRLALERAGR